MAKLIVLALAFAALVAFATAHKTIVTTTTIQDQDPSSAQQCSQELQGERFRQCENYLQQNQGLDQCCNELERVNEKCQCAAVKQVLRDAQEEYQQQQGQQAKISGYQQIEKLRKRAQNLSDRCNLQTKCKIGTVVTTTSITENIYENPAQQSSQQCREIVEQESFNQCQMYIAQQLRSPRTHMMSINKQGKQTQGVKQCCNELKNVREECQCEAMKEVYRKLTRHQDSQFGVQQQQMEVVQRIIQNLPNQCDIEVEQCRIPSEMF